MSGLDSRCGCVAVVCRRPSVSEFVDVTGRRPSFVVLGDTPVISLTELTVSAVAGVLPSKL